MNRRFSGCSVKKLRRTVGSPPPLRRHIRRCRWHQMCSRCRKRPRRRAGCHHSRSRQQECLNIRTRKSLQDRCKGHKRQARQRSRPHRRRCRQRLSAGNRHRKRLRRLLAITVAVAFRDVSTSALEISWPLHTPQASSSPTQSSHITSRQRLAAVNRHRKRQGVFWRHYSRSRRQGCRRPAISPHYRFEARTVCG